MDDTYVGFKSGDANHYRYVQNNPVNFVDPIGLWSVGLEGYAGVGGGLSIGRDPDCGWFYTAKVGAGEGGGFQFDPRGTSPSYDAGDKRGQRNITLGVFMGANASYGPISVGYNMGSGANVQVAPDKVNGYAYTGPPYVQLGKSFGGKLGYAIGFELSGKVSQ